MYTFLMSLRFILESVIQYEFMMNFMPFDGFSLGH